MTAISPRQLHERVLQEQKLQLLDVRSPEEHERVHVPGVQLAPLDDIDDETFPAESGFSRDLPIYIFCSSGNRAKQASEKLGRIGYTQCHFVEGGTEAWVKAGLPVNRGTNAIISVENQVRVAAGGLVVVSFLLTYVNPVFVWLSAFVGVGLLISGFTDWCGMGMIISRMPWNRRADISDPVEK